MNNASKGFFGWICIAIAALIIGLFVANYPALKEGADAIRTDVQTQIEQMLPDDEVNDDKLVGDTDPDLEEPKTEA